VFNPDSAAKTDREASNPGADSLGSKRSQAVQNVLNDLNFLNELNSIRLKPIDFAAAGPRVLSIPTAESGSISCDEF
jgi:hypothetical protein